MKTSVWAVGAVLALAAVAPVAAEDSMGSNSGIWAPWATTAEAPAPQARPTQIATKMVAEVPAQETLTHRFLHIDRFWVVGSFR